MPTAKAGSLYCACMAMTIFVPSASRLNQFLILMYFQKNIQKPSFSVNKFMEVLCARDKKNNRLFFINKTLAISVYMAYKNYIDGELLKRISFPQVAN